MYQSGPIRTERSRAWFAGWVCAAVGLAGSGTAGAASLTPMGDFPSAAFVSSMGTAVSDDGAVALGSGNSLAGNAFRWTPDGGVQGLGFRGEGSDISADGSVVVGRQIIGNQAFRWTTTGGMTSLGDLPGGTNASAALALNPQGSIVVGYSNSTNGDEAFRWTAAGGMVPLGDLPGGQFFSSASAVSADGSVIVGGGASAIGRQAVRWNAAGEIQALSTLQSGALDVTPDGSVAVGHIGSTGSRSAVRWDLATGVATGLGEFAGGAFEGVANAINTDASVIVGYSYSSLGQEAFHWTPTGGMQRTWDVLLASGVNPAAGGWTRLAEARDVSVDGRTVVGWGVRNGNTEGFVAVIPEPAGLGVLAGLALVAGSRARRRRCRGARPSA